jgi:tRNA pseudouridine55 synthase
VSGILNIDKPAGWTSHDVVARVRSLTRQKRVGHAGTLDPMATGVLLVCVGQATRVSEYLMELRKLYRARIRFGIATDTYDAEGRVTAQSDVIPSRQEIEALLPRFTGSILQAPPPYSALKVEGEPAYRRARRGEAVEQAPRPVEIYEIRLLAWAPPDLEIEVACGRGTYIRSLANDLGQAAGSAAHLAALERRAVGHFTIEDATSMPEFEALVADDLWQQRLSPLDEALLQYEALVVSAADAERLKNGQPVQVGGVAGGQLRRAYGPDGVFIALVEGDAQANAWRPLKVFV